jgi:hypothetical protein
VDKAHNNLLARVGTALYQQDNLQQADLDAVYDEIEALVAKVERLRAHRESCVANLLKGYETGKADERAAVVAWMRDLGDQVPVARDQWIADCIERGEHRREENE